MLACFRMSIDCSNRDWVIQHLHHIPHIPIHTSIKMVLLGGPLGLSYAFLVDEKNAQLT